MPVHLLPDLLEMLEQAKEELTEEIPDANPACLSWYLSDVACWMMWSPKRRRAD